jgi:hypothetical protein
LPETFLKFSSIPTYTHRDLQRQPCKILQRQPCKFTMP